jgi:hypothetical protein
MHKLAEPDYYIEVTGWVAGRVWESVVKRGDSACGALPSPDSG